MQNNPQEAPLTALGSDDDRHLKSRQIRLTHYRDIILKQERELEDYRARLKEEQLARDKTIQTELEAREQFFREREKKLLERQRDFENQWKIRQADVEQWRERLQQEDNQLQQAMLELQQEKDRYKEETQRRMELTAKRFVSQALETLDHQEKRFHRIARVWSGIGAAALCLGIGFWIAVALTSLVSWPHPMTWALWAFLAFKGVVALALVVGLARYAFLFSRSYMQEALKNADRRHAIHFGQFYLESYGVAADWSQVKDAFEHWNMAASNAFSPEQHHRPEWSSLDKALTLLERATQAWPKRQADATT